jgi:hypothetical protein
MGVEQLERRKNGITEHGRKGVAPANMNGSNNKESMQHKIVHVEQSGEKWLHANSNITAKAREREEYMVPAKKIE